MLTLAVLTACSPTPSAASPTPFATSTPFVPPSLTNAPTAIPSASATRSPVVATEHKSRLILSVPYAPAVNALGATTRRVGGLNPEGVSTDATVAYTVEPLSQKGIDLYARRDGALCELATDWGGEGSAYVYALMPPVGTPAAAAVRPVPAAPVAFGRRCPIS